MRELKKIENFNIEGFYPYFSILVGWVFHYGTILLKKLYL